MYTIDELRKDLERYNKAYAHSCDELESSAWADDDGERAMQTQQKWLVEQLLIVLPKLALAERTNARLERENASLQAKIDSALAIEERHWMQLEHAGWNEARDEFRLRLTGGER